MVRGRVGVGGGDVHACHVHTLVYGVRVIERVQIWGGDIYSCICMCMCMHTHIGMHMVRAE